MSPLASSRVFLPAFRSFATATNKLYLLASRHDLAPLLSASGMGMSTGAAPVLTGATPVLIARGGGKAEDTGSGAATGTGGESGTGDTGAERSARPYGRGCG